MKPYKKLLTQNIGDVADVMQNMILERTNDIKDFDNLNNVFISGRKVGKVPTGATDVTSSDKIGDFNIASIGGTFYLISLVNNGGTPVWARVAMTISW
jgi:hypothetical protein